MAKAKICGIARPEDLTAAAHAGAAFAGFVFYPPSPRFVSPEAAAAIVAEANIGKKIASVAVTVDADDALLEDIAVRLSPAYFQLHGKESPARLSEIRRRFPKIGIIKATPIRCGDDVAAALSYMAVADMLLFDAKAPASDLPGGNGVQFDWRLLAGREIAKPWILAGGLNAGNVAQAIALTGAAIVDASSGVESAPGVKNAQAIREFVSCAA